MSEALFGQSIGAGLPPYGIPAGSDYTLLIDARQGRQGLVDQLGLLLPGASVGPQDSNGTVAVTGATKTGVVLQNPIVRNAGGNTVAYDILSMTAVPVTPGKVKIVPVVFGGKLPVSIGNIPGKIGGVAFTLQTGHRYALTVKTSSGKLPSGFGIPIESDVEGRVASGARRGGRQEHGRVDRVLAGRLDAVRRGGSLRPLGADDLAGYGARRRRGRDDELPGSRGRLLRRRRSRGGMVDHQEARRLRRRRGAARRRRRCRIESRRLVVTACRAVAEPERHKMPPCQLIIIALGGPIVGMANGSGTGQAQDASLQQILALLGGGSLPATAHTVIGGATYTITKTDAIILFD